MAHGQRRIRVGIDTGGTFTDVVAVHTATGRRVSTKTPSTPDDPSTAFVRGLAAALAMPNQVLRGREDKAT